MAQFRLACALAFEKKFSALNGKDREHAISGIERTGIKPDNAKGTRITASKEDIAFFDRQAGKFMESVKSWGLVELYLGALFGRVSRLQEGARVFPCLEEGNCVMLNFMQITGKDSEASFEFMAGKDCKSSYACLNLVEMAACASARLGLAKSNEGKTGLSVVSKIIIGESAHAHIDTWEFGSGDITAVTTAELAGAGATCELNGAFFGFGKADFSIDTSAFSMKKDTKSAIAAKGALDDSAKCDYSGILDVGAKAAGSATDFREKVLMLSGNAASFSVPSLDIRNNDITAGHGAAAGKIGEDELFYLKSRGISEDMAKGMVARGFLHEPLSKMGERHRKLFEGRLATRLGDI